MVTPTVRPGVVRPSRRRFLRSALGGLSAALALGPAGCRRRSDEQVVVIGAGIAGLAAASRLRGWGFDVIVLEARERIGGRIHSVTFEGATLDLGASWIHGITGNPLYKLARKIGAETIATDYESESIFDLDGTEITDSEWREVEDLMERLYEEADAIPDRSLRELLDELEPKLDIDARTQRLFRLAVRILVEIPYAVDAEELAAGMASWENAMPGENVMLPGGMGQFPAALAAGLEIRFGTFVSHIRYDPSRIILGTTTAAPLERTRACQGCHENRKDPPGASDSLFADRVLVTVPLGVLKSGMIRFTPRLPDEKLEAIDRLGVGTMSKILLRFNKRFWPEETAFFSQMKGRGSQVMEFWNPAPAGIGKTLVAFLAGNQARLADLWNEEAVADLLMHDLRAMFGPRIPRPVALARSGWHTDLFALGSYPHVPPGADLGDAEILARPVDDRLFFAGDATDAGFMGTAHAAYLSGLRAAGEVARAAS